MATMQTVAGLVAAHGVTMTATPTDRNQNMIDDWGKGAAHWLCTLECGGRKMVVLYSMGSAHRVWRKDAPRLMRYGGACTAQELADVQPGVRVQQKYLTSQTLHTEAMVRDLSEPTPPTVDSVLDCLASDASMYDNARNFADWAAGLGLDTDSIKAEKSYRTCADQAKELRHVLGAEAYNALLWECEHL